MHAVMIFALLQLLDIKRKRLKLTGNIINDAILHRKTLCEPDARMCRADVPERVDWLRWIIRYAAREPPVDFCTLQFLFVDRAFNRTPRRAFVYVLAFIRITA